MSDRIAELRALLARRSLSHPDADADAALIVAAVNALPALLEIAETAQEVLADASPNRDSTLLEADAWWDKAQALDAALRKLEAL